MNILALPPLIALFMSLSALVTTLRSYSKKQYREILHIALGFFLLSLQPLAISIIYIFGNTVPESFTTPLSKFVMIVLILGSLTIYLALKSLTGSNYVTREKIMIALAFFGLGIVVNAVYTHWNGSNWELLYRPENAIIIMILPLAWINIEIMMYSNQRMKGYKANKADYTMLLGWTVEVSSILAVIVERQYSSVTFYYLIITALGYMLIALAVLIDPNVILPKDIGGEFIMISDRRSGVPIIQKNFRESKEDDESFLFASGMSGILAMLGEMTGQENIPEEFGYADLKIMFEHSENLIVYYVGIKAVNPIRVIIREILTQIEHKIDPEHINILPRNLLDEIEEIIKTKLYFTVQK
ncbi:MAG: hypothetical protein INQ03_17275 [Candidatus Heimdallarchaeota archaeon]|nr:hypothetical protein [Candidatus Heimdallarchaeota archaeon]